MQRGDPSLFLIQLEYVVNLQNFWKKKHEIHFSLFSLIVIRFSDPKIKNTWIYFIALVDICKHVFLTQQIPKIDVIQHIWIKLKRHLYSNEHNIWSKTINVLLFWQKWNVTTNSFVTTKQKDTCLSTTL